MQKIPTNIVSPVCKTKLRPLFIGNFTVVAKEGFLYTLYLPRKLLTHPVLNVGMIKPYWNPRHVEVEALVPRESDLSQAVTSGSRHLTTSPFEAASVPVPADASAPLSACSEFELTSHEDGSPRVATQCVLLSIHWTPSTSLDDQRSLQFNVEASSEALLQWPTPLYYKIAWKFRVV